jgi:hypothetical protein
MPFNLNPKQMALQMLEQQAQVNPMFAQLLTLARNNDSQGIENMVRGFLESQGVDYDKEFNSFNSMFKR